MPLVPPERMGDAFVEIHEEAPDTPKTSEFHDYIVDTWLDEDSLFPT